LAATQKFIADDDLLAFVSRISLRQRARATRLD
jgi:hypothetical protein